MRSAYDREQESDSLFDRLLGGLRRYLVDQRYNLGMRTRPESSRCLGESISDHSSKHAPEIDLPSGFASTGGFHNPAAYHVMNWLSAAWADLAVLAARQAEKLHLNAVTGLPAKLVRDGQSSSTRLLAIGSYDMASRARDHAIPALIQLYSAGSVQTDTIMPIFLAFGKEDQASRCLDVCLAILCGCSSQALYVARREPAPGLRGFLAGVRDRFPPVESPRDLGADAMQLADAFAAAAVGRISDFNLSGIERNE